MEESNMLSQNQVASDPNTTRAQQLLDESNVFVKYLPPDLTDDKFNELFEQYGKIVSCKIMVDQTTGKSLGYGFVRYSNSESSNKAIQAMNGIRISNKRLLCKLANMPSNVTSHLRNPALQSQIPSNNVYIKPLPKHFTEGDLKSLFGKYGTIEDCKVMIDKQTGQSRQIGFVRFLSKEDALRSIQSMNKLQIDPTLSPLTVKFADTKEQRNLRKTINKNQKQQYLFTQSPPHYTSMPSPPHLTNTSIGIEDPRLRGQMKSVHSSPIQIPIDPVHGTPYYYHPKYYPQVHPGTPPQFHYGIEKHFFDFSIFN
eukprot:TRINITY_DN2868_c0_g1_i3.p1 TRINITY_DN2868_c0_g1~~TRINITY_DN2868_c0_g1_i3.p1  ORF type:complete len:312 (+),score=38.89 TRINITY_DN2868_c0_g1_i3:74-1009(+)